MKGERRDTDDAILFGDPILSKKLPHPLTFDQNLAEKLSLGILFVEGFTENQRIGSATRQWRTLTKKDVELILDEIKELEKRGFAAADVILCTDEVLEIREIDVENFIVEHPHIIGSDLILKGRQRDTKSGRLDLLFEDKNNGFVVAELKLGSAGRDTIRQLRGYMHEVKSETNKEVRGAIVCKDVLPIFEKEFEKLTDIQIFQYGWNLVINPRKWE